MFKRLFKGFIYFLGICALIGMLASACESEEATYVETEQGSVMVIPDEPDSEVEIITPEEPVVVEEKEPEVPLEYRMALKKAQNYIRTLDYSKEELKGQLEYHEFSADAIQYALDNVQADWYQEAVDQAKNYLEIFAYSRQDLYDQLQYEGFTEDEIQYAINQVYGE